MKEGDTMNKFLTHNSTKYKVWRTIVQAIISFLIVDGGANLLEITSHIPIEGRMKTLLFGLCMTILTGLMPTIGEMDEPMDEEELPKDFYEGKEGRE